MQHEKLTKQILACQSEITRLEGDRERCNAAIADGEQHAAALDTLRQRRVDESAQAFVEQRKANLVEIDKEIAAAEKVRAASAEQAAAARGAVNIIEQRLADQHAELATARSALKSIVHELINQRATKAREEFNAAVDALRDKLAEVSALDSMAATLRGVVSQHSASQLMVDCLRDEGLKIFTARGPWAPGWLHTFSASVEYESLATEFRGAGLDI